MSSDGDIHEDVLQAGLLFEKSGLARASEETRNARRALAETLKELAIERARDPDIGTIYWALGKAGEASLVPFLQHSLALHVDRDPVAAYQIMIALENHGEKLFADPASRSFNNTEENSQLARAYLSDVGVSLTSDASGSKDP